MSLPMFQFIDKVIETFESFMDDLEFVSKDIKNYLDNLLIKNNDGYLNVNSRIKTVLSLKEKIIRNNYYKKYSTAEGVLNNLSDLIGVRIECRFIEDEQKIYNLLKKHFNEVDKEGLYYNKNYKNIGLGLSEKQPQEQKNGFKIFKIDGVYKLNGKIINFELQIKSLVNIFWSEIEHKIIYKNYNYMLLDKLFKEMMNSIKNSLFMIDNQMLIIYDQFNKFNSIDSRVRKDQIEKVLSKIIYDIFSSRVKNDLGFMIDFRKSCDLIMEYIFHSHNIRKIENYNEILLNTLNRFNELSEIDMSFNREIVFKREIVLKDQFSQIVGNSILNIINSDFQWNLFFKMLFEIEPGECEEKFERFVFFLKSRFCKNEDLKKLNNIFDEDNSEKIRQDILISIAYGFQEINSIEFVHEKTINEINRCVEIFIDVICKKITCIDEWIKVKRVYLEFLYIKILSIFYYKIEGNRPIDIIEKIKLSCKNIKVGDRVLRYMEELEQIEKIKAEEVVDIFKLL